MFKKMLVLTVGFIVISAMASVANWYFYPEKTMVGETKIIAKSQTISHTPLPKSLEIINVQLRAISVNRRDIALIKGEIINRTGDKLAIPQLDIVLRGKDGQNTVSWRHRSLQAALKAGESIHFSSKFTTEIYPDSVVKINLVSGNGS